jgi:hypothetical protein
MIIGRAILRITKEELEQILNLPPSWRIQRVTEDLVTDSISLFVESPDLQPMSSGLVARTLKPRKVEVPRVALEWSDKPR